MGDLDDPASQETALMDSRELTVEDEFAALRQAQDDTPPAFDFAPDGTTEDELRRELERQKRAFDLAMTASVNGTETSRGRSVAELVPAESDLVDASVDCATTCPDC